MTIFVANEQQDVPVSGADWEARVRTLLERLGLPDSTQLSITFVNDAAIAELNRDYRGKDRPTDVLSFPQAEFAGLEEAVAELCKATKPAEDAPPAVLGDVVVSAETALRQAHDYGHSPEREIGFLIVHGLLHLLGEDHETPEQEARMRALQRDCLAVWGLERAGQA